MHLCTPDDWLEQQTGHRLLMSNGLVLYLCKQKVHDLPVSCVYAAHTYASAALFSLSVLQVQAVQPFQGLQQGSEPDRCANDGHICAAGGAEHSAL